MLGAIAGDIIGSVYEARPIKRTDFPLFRDDCFFTDDTVLTVAVADALLSGVPYAEKLREYFRRYPERGYGPFFRRWATAAGAGPYGSRGNGSAMRVSAIGWAFGTLEEVLAEAERSAAATHNHPEGIRGAQAAAGALFLARTGSGKEQIREWVRTAFPHYRIDRTVDEIRPTYRFDATCEGTVPEALVAFFDSSGYEDAVRKAVSLRGDSDTLACITGGIAEAFYGLPHPIAETARGHLPADLLAVVEAGLQKWGGRPGPGYVAT